MLTNQTANLRPLPSSASLPGSLGGLPRQAEGLEGGTNVFLRQLLKHGKGNRPFAYALEAPMGFWNHVCLHHRTNVEMLSCPWNVIQERRA